MDECSPYRLGRQRVMAVRTSPVSCKGEALLYRVTLEDGEPLRATGQHRCLTPRAGDGWRSLRQAAALFSLPPLSSEQRLSSTAYTMAQVASDQRAIRGAKRCRRAVMVSSI